MSFSVFATGSPDFDTDGRELALDDLLADYSGPTSTNSQTVDVAAFSPLAGTCTAVLSDTVWGLKTANAAGVALMPSSGQVFAPLDGTVAAAPGQEHAIGIQHASGLELLIHIGLTTYELANFFSREVKDGETVAAGDLLLQFDLPALIKKGYDPTTAIWCPNATAISDIHMGPTHIGDPLFTAVIPAHQ